MSRYDVGIFGWWYNYNYGANLTYFALNRAIKNMGYSVIMLCRTGKYISGGSVPRRFAKQYYDYSESYDTIEGLHAYNDLCGAFVLGSDQVWNPVLERYTGEQFFLSFADDERIKLSYAVSFGNYAGRLPREFIRKYGKLIDRFDKITVRENYAKNLLKNSMSIETEQMCDPVFLLRPEDYNELTEKSDLDLPDRYVLNFILDPTDEKIEACKEIRKNKGIDAYINLTDIEDAEKKAELFCGENVLTDTSIENFVKAFKNAEYVVTDSFHGTCFAIIFNKPFISFANKDRGVRRFESLLEWTDLKDRLFYDVTKVDMESLGEIDYEKVNSILDQGRNKGLKWLNEELRKSKVVTSQIKDMCTGCGACASGCPAGALTMKPDEWGYIKPVLDDRKCTYCGACTKICPSISGYSSDNSLRPDLYAFIAKDEEVLKRSSSGGIFEILADETFKNDGVVVGAAWTNDFDVRHIIIERKEDLHKLQKSKYMYSRVDKVFRRIKELLDENRIVLFTGCPCQVAGINSFLKKKYDNLFTIDLLCANAPSSKLFKKYLNEKYKSKVLEYQFRHKIEKEGINCTTVKVKKADGEEEILRGSQGDLWQKAFHSHLMTPVHCEKCRFSKLPRPADITVGDFWGVTSKGTNYGTQMGVSAVLCNSEKGKMLYNSISPQYYRVNEKVPLEWLDGNGCVIKGHNYASEHRNDFYDAIRFYPFSEAVDKALNPENNKKYADGHNLLPGNVLCEYETDFWKSDRDNDKIIFRPIMTDTPRGHFVCFLLKEETKEKQKYEFTIKFKSKTDFSCINFTLMNRKTKRTQIIDRFNKDTTDTDGWKEIKISFYCDLAGYDCVSVGAAHITGKDAYISIKNIELSIDDDTRESILERVSP